MTKAANRKLKRKHRGRPRDEDCERTVSGRKSRSNPAPTDGSGKPMSHVALEARQRINGLSADKAADPHASTALGRLWLSSAITTPMREAGEAYKKLYDTAMRAMQAPIALTATDRPPSKDWGAMGPVEIGTEKMTAAQLEYTDKAIRAVSSYRVMKDALKARGYLSAVELVVIHDVEPQVWDLALLCAGTQVLAEKMGLGQEGA